MAAVTVHVIFYSWFGHVHRLAEAIAQGASEISDVKVALFRVPECFPDETLQACGVAERQQAFSHIPVIQLDHLAQADAYLFGTPTRFGHVCAQMRHFFEQLKGARLRQSLTNKIAGLFTHTHMQQAAMSQLHGLLLDLGLLLAGKPFSGQLESVPTVTQQTAGLSMMPTESDLKLATLQGRQIAQLAYDIKFGTHRQVKAS